MGRRLASWKCHYLSKGGKLVLLKSLLSSILTFFLSVFQALCSIVNQLKHMQRDFLWGSSLDVKKIHWVGWKEVCKPL